MKNLSLFYIIKKIFFFVKNILLKIMHICYKILQKLSNIITPQSKHEHTYLLIIKAKIILMAISIAIIIIIFKLFSILTKDIYQHKLYTNQKKSSRVSIVDRNGKLLAGNISIYDLYLQPSNIEDIDKCINDIDFLLLNKISQTRKAEIVNKLKEKKDSDKKIFIKAGLSFQERQSLINKKIKGLFFEEKEKRFYTSESANIILGYCPTNEKCISGIEKSMFNYLSNGNNKPLELSIDNTIQLVVRDLLYKKMIETSSKGATGIVMNIKTGEILTAVSLPDCDYNNYNSCTNESLFNNYSYGIYELGSVFKIFLAGLALKSGISPYKEYTREAYKMDKYTIHDIDNKDNKGGKLNLIDIIRLSSNVGCAKIMEDIDLYDQYKFLSNLNLLTKIKTELPEIGKPQYPKKWSQLNGVTISYGHGISVSPLQYTAAVASLLNNYPVNPTFLKQKQNKTNKKKFFYLNEEQYDILKDIMRQVINNGGGKRAYIDQYDIGGKTGTAIQIKNGKYDRYSMILSFVAVVPMYDPEYVFFITLHYPQTNIKNNYIVRSSYILGETMKQIISFVGPILNINPI